MRTSCERSDVSACVSKDLRMFIFVKYCRVNNCPFNFSILSNVNSRRGVLCIFFAEKIARIIEESIIGTGREDRMCASV